MFPSIQRTQGTRRQAQSGDPTASVSYVAAWRAAFRSADRACCCPARPAVIAAMPPAPGRPHVTELLLCHHHHRVHRLALMAAGAAIVSPDGITTILEAPDPVPAR